MSAEAGGRMRERVQGAREDRALAPAAGDKKHGSARTGRSGRFRIIREGCALNHRPKEGRRKRAGEGPHRSGMRWGKQNVCTADLSLA